MFTLNANLSHSLVLKWSIVCYTAELSTCVVKSMRQKKTEAAMTKSVKAEAEDTLLCLSITANLYQI